MQQFRTDFSIPQLGDPIDYHGAVLMTGSCFSENIVQRLSAYKFHVQANPSGIIYNPISLAAELSRIIENKPVGAETLFLSEGVYRHFDFHSRFAHPEQQTAADSMNESTARAHTFLNTCTHLVVTFGTSVVYKLTNTGAIVANNHKLPAGRFQKIQLTSTEIVEAWQPLIGKIKQAYPQLNIMFTVSPVRHIRDGMIENQLSKSVLIRAVHELKNRFSHIYYFPAYEIMMDDLRDYRFYEKDMIHPNEIAVDYIFEKFKTACISPDCFSLMDEISSITAAVQHQPFFPDTEAHQRFKKQMFERVGVLQKQYPHIDMSTEADHFSN